MRWLLWKEYRQNRLIVLITLAILTLPHTVAIYAAMRWPNYGPPQFGTPWARNLFASSMYGLVVSSIALVLIGGNAIAGERANRSAEFQAYLPIPRSTILAAKIMISAAVAAIIWLPNCAVLVWIASCKTMADLAETFEFLWVLSLVLTYGLVSFCTAWLFSSFLRSPTFCVAAGLLVPWSLVTFLIVKTRLPLHPDDLLSVTTLHVTGITVSLVCFGLGIWLYLRRVEP